MLGNEFRTPVQLFEATLTTMHATALERSFVSEDTLIVEDLIARGKSTAIAWLCDEEFKAGLDKNPTSYYFGIAVNLMVCGMYCADVYVNNDKDLSDFKYTDIYEGGLWNNVYRLLEDKTDESKNQFQQLARELYDIWTALVKPYNKLSNFSSYIIDTMVAFFQIGVCIKMSLFGY